MSDRRSTTAAARSTQQGTSLVMILVFITSIGLLGSALASYQLTLNRQSFATRRIQVRETATNAAVEWVVNGLRSGQDALCHGAVTSDVITITGREVSVSCRPLDRRDGWRNSFALYLNRTGDESSNVVRIRGALGKDPDQATVIGPIYNGASDPDAKAGWAMEAPLRVAGDIVVPDGSGDCASPATTRVPDGVIALYDNAKVCATPLERVTPAAVPPPCEVREACLDPEPVNLDTSGKPTKLVPACRVFSPGYYSRPPSLAATNYFRPGVYAFEMKGEWRVSSAVRGGDPAPASDTADEEPVLSSVPRCAGAPEPASPSGVVFVLGVYARINVRDTGRLELFTHTVDGTELPGIVAGGLPGVTEWAQRNERPLADDIVTVGDSEPEFALHGGVFAPEHGISLTGRGEVLATIRNTVVVGRFDLTATDTVREPGAGFGIVVPTGTSKSYVIRARSCPGSRDRITRDACTAPPPPPVEQELCSTASVVVYDDAKRTVRVQSFRVDRDPSPSDPAGCTDT